MNIKKCLFFIAIVNVVLFSCKKEDNQPIPDPFDPFDVLPSGEAQSYNNGIFWSFDCFTSESPLYPNKYSLVMSHFNENGLHRGEFHFRNFLKIIGTYYPDQYVYAFGTSADSLFTCSFITALGDGDIIGDPYVLLKDSAMVFTVDKISPDGEIEGTFSGTLIKEIVNMEHDPASPDTLVFTEGTYVVKL